MTLIYISNCNTSVFNSQVIFLVNHLEQHYNFDKLFLLIGCSSKKEKKEIPLDLINHKVEVKFYKRFPDYPFFEWFNIWGLKKVINKINAENLSKAIIHVRTEILGYYVIKAVHSSNIKKVLIDVRGALYSEIVIYYRNFLKKQLKIKLLNNAHNSIRKSNASLSCVSSKLKEYLISNYSHKQENIIVNPCAYPDFFQFNLEQRNKIRNKLNLQDEDLLVVFSSGGVRDWQNSDLIINYLANCKSIKVLNLSRKIFRNENVFNFFVPIKEMPNYLSSADVAIIIRENNLVNQVASPVKFSEYLACGLPVIANDGVSMIVQILNSQKTGKVVSRIEQVDEKLIHEISNLNRENIMKVAKQHFSIENISRSYYNFYCSNT